MKRFHPILILLPGLVLLVAVYVLMTVRYITTTGILNEADFKIFYTAGRIAQTAGYSQLYKLKTQLQVQDTLLDRDLQADQLLPFNHPPFLVPILQILCSPDYTASYWRWILVMIILLLMTAYIMERTLRAKKTESGTRFVFIVIILLFYPVFLGLLKGQDTAFLLLGGTLWLYGIVVENDTIAGLGLAMTVIRPQIAIILAIPFLFKRIKVWWWFCAGVMVLATYSLMLVGLQGAGDYIHLLVVSANGQGYGMDQNAMFNFTGLILRLFPLLSIDLIHGLAWGIFGMAIVGLSVLWKLSKQIDLHHIILALSLSLFAAPHLHYHDLALMALSLFGLGLVAIKSGKWTFFITISLSLFASVILLIGEWWDPLRFTTPYLLMLVLPLLAWWVEKRMSNKFEKSEGASPGYSKI